MPICQQNFCKHKKMVIIFNDEVVICFNCIDKIRTICYNTSVCCKLSIAKTLRFNIRKETAIMNKINTTVNEREERENILRQVREYCEKYHSKPEYKEGDRIPYASRVYDSDEMCNLVDSSLEFWLTSGRYTDEFEKAFAESYAAGGPAVIDCHIDMDEMVLPMTPPGGTIDQIIVKKKDINL